MIKNGTKTYVKLSAKEIADTTEEESVVDEEFDISLPSPKIKSYREAHNH